MESEWDGGGDGSAHSCMFTRGRDWDTAPSSQDWAGRCGCTGRRCWLVGCECKDEVDWGNKVAERLTDC